ncbi:MULTISPECIES: hypothetical protein [unclassified Curtobacterium]|uniref:hypothetical protein n=1 Tax=unclassified Curtobacterium TaxID=257496 RepID=UPI003811B5A5
MDDIDATRDLALAEASGIRFNWMRSPDNDTRMTSIYEDAGRWIVSTTNERATEESVKEYDDRGEAVTYFVSRVSASVRVVGWRKSTNNWS